MTVTDGQHRQLDTGYPHTLRPELHKSLMARSIDYWVAQGITFWDRDDGCECLAYGYKANGVPKLAIKVVGFTDPEQAIAATLGSVITGDTSDGYHTFNELYHHRAVLFSVIVRDHSELAWKSKLHHDGSMYDGMFIVGIETPHGQATYHYDIDPYWDMFECKELDRAPEWDGHTPDESIARIATLGSSNCTNDERTNGTCHRLPADNYGTTCIVRGHGYEIEFGYWKCSKCGTNCFEGARYCMNCGAKAIG